mmetsp:Transcript_23324/g.32809  ORF Transcript_23324/g.32809 Transcript_23324/m.32809 type:complete len:167 (-) Transcript_23324:222-722(-)|eukprot:CAMPEP_0184862802 /NCGR_PEP_ID=MMETSP0580-20130426/7836_1 /TAXON_ID=1118495 /ORGANISM="Dactyliosolen fragilissimus" /LENGTH=166 /DNA_ID=CAMNT_0027360795 /DNA_START=99 /DNA_END=599 /DNA_ORIENTATION=-
MQAQLVNTLSKIPVPLFGSASTAFKAGCIKASRLPKYASWGLPAAMGITWFIWPAVDPEFKQSLSFGSSSSAESPAPAATNDDEKIVLGDEAKAKVENAYVAHAPPELSEDEKSVMKAVAKGDFTDLEKDWDAFAEKASNPGEDDDDDDDDEEDDDDDEEEEEDDE